MRNFQIKFLTLLGFGLLLGLSSCKDYLDVNIDPNQSTETTIQLQLAAAQMQTAIGMGERINPTCGIWAQYHTGGPGVALRDEEQFLISAAEMNQMWQTFYRSSANLNYIIKDNKEPNYVAIAKIWQAYNYTTLVDMVGDIPFTEALKGDIADGSLLHPKYDNAKDVVYPGCETMLKDAIALIDASDARLHPGEDDLIYGGDMSLWRKFANSLLLKMYLRTGNQTEAANISADDVITDNTENCLMKFYDAAGQRNPFWNAAKSTSLGNYYVAATTAFDHMASTDDPRVDFFYDVSNSGQHVALYPGSIETVPAGASFSTPNGARKTAGGLIFSPTAPVIFFSAWEGNLLLAEAAARANDLTAAEGAYEAGITANFEYLGVGSDSAYLAENPLGANPIKTIALQKWTCMNGLQPIESWIETRRIDSPSFPVFSSPGGVFKNPTKNALPGGAFPSIMPYPDTEESLNRNFPGQHPVTNKVFWDN